MLFTKMWNRHASEQTEIPIKTFPHAMDYWRVRYSSYSRWSTCHHDNMFMCKA